MFIVVVTMASGRKVVFTVRNSDDPNVWSFEDAEAHIEKKWGFEMREQIVRVWSVPDDGYPYFV